MTALREAQRCVRRHRACFRDKTSVAVVGGEVFLRLSAHDDRLAVASRADAALPVLDGHPRVRKSDGRSSVAAAPIPVAVSLRAKAGVS